MAQKYSKCWGLRRFSNTGKIWAWRLGWKFSGRKSGSARTELCSQIYRGETSGTQPENSALHANGVVTFHLLSEWRSRVAYVWGEIAYYFHWLLLLRIEGTKCTMVSTGPNVVSHGYIYMITWITSYQGYTHFGLQNTVVYTSVNTSVITSVKTSVSFITDEVECNLL